MTNLIKPLIYFSNHSNEYLNQIFIILQTPAVLAEKLNRMSSENQKLNQMLGRVVENYSLLQNQVIRLMFKSRKRKAGCDSCNFNRNGSDQYCGCCSDDDSCYKRPRESSKPKVMRVLVSTPVSDSSLVRNKCNTHFSFTIIRFRKFSRPCFLL